MSLARRQGAVATRSHSQPSTPAASPAKVAASPGRLSGATAASDSVDVTLNPCGIAYPAVPQRVLEAVYQHWAQARVLRGGALLQLRYLAGRIFAAAADEGSESAAAAAAAGLKRRAERPRGLTVIRDDVFGSDSEQDEEEEVTTVRRKTPRGTPRSVATPRSADSSGATPSSARLQHSGEKRPRGRPPRMTRI